MALASSSVALMPSFLILLQLSNTSKGMKPCDKNSAYLFGFFDQIMEKLVVFEVLVAHVVLDLFLEGINISHFCDM